MSQDDEHRETSPVNTESGRGLSPVMRLRNYLEALRMEMRHVSWPTWRQVRTTTCVVIFFTFAMAAFFCAINWVGEKVYQLFLGR
jgi:preprotein translocase SecE subunit